MASKKYLDFDLSIESTKTGYRARVLYSPAGQASREFSLPFTEQDLTIFMLSVGRTRKGVRRMESQEVETAKDFGGKLYRSIFSEEVHGLLRSSLDEAGEQGAGLRIRLRVDAPELANLPWEYLYNPALNRFLTLSVDTPIVRYLEVQERVRPLAVKPPLKVLVMISSPSDYEGLDVEKEWANLRTAVEELEQSGQVIIDRVETASLSALRRKLLKDEYHIFHFIGHGVFDEASQDGVLLFENENHLGVPASGQDLGIILLDHDSLRLAVINACEGARTSAKDQFAGVAQSLVQQGIPAVIAMQFEVSDKAAITFAHEIYAAITRGEPVDAALGQARKAIFTDFKNIEWGTPVLFMRSPDGQIFDIAPARAATETGLKPVAPEAWLEIETPGQLPRRLPLTAAGLTLGREAPAQVVLPSTTVSRQHARITFINGRFMLEDTGSRNGTALNSTLITAPTRLNDRDTITAGDVRILFRAPSLVSTDIKQVKLEPADAPPPSRSEPRGEAQTLLMEARAAQTVENWQVAVEKYRALLALDPDHPARSEYLVVEQRLERQNAAALLVEAQAANSRRDWETAIARLQAALLADPGNQRARTELAQAQKNLRNATRYAEAKAAVSSEDWALAIDRFKAILEDEPGHGGIRSELKTVEQKYKAAGLYAEGLRYLEAGAWEQAIASLQASLAADPAHVPARQALGTAQSSLKQEQQAKIASLVGQASQAEGRQAWQEEIELLQAALAIDPSHTPARSMLVLAQGRLKQQQAGVLYEEAQAAAAAQNWALAANRLQSLLALDPAHPVARAELANAQRQQKIATLWAEARSAHLQGNWRGAAAKYQALLSIDPEHAEASASLAEVSRILQEQNIALPPAQPEPKAGWQAAAASLLGGKEDRDPAAPAVRLYTISGFDGQSLVEEIRQYFLQNGYESQVVQNEGSTIIQGKKGGLRSLVGMGQAATVILEPAEDGIKTSVGGGKWLEQGAAIAVSMFVLWPLLITGAAGILGQKGLMDTLWRIVDYHITSRGGVRHG